jgi:aspartate aminotransferase-like enzyme
MKMPLVMSPGPTTVNEEVRRAMSRGIVNPDLDPEFFEFYRETAGKLKKLMRTKNDVLILSSEAILGLEAACASLIEPGDKVLVIENGIFGKGFGSLAEIYGGDVSYLTCDYRKGIDEEKLRVFLSQNKGFKIATIVHCETPSGLTNPVDKLCPALKEHGIITVVDTVSGVGGEELEVDGWGIDIAIGGSQKCLSAPPGLCFMSISEAAWSKILNREKPIAGFYANLAVWKNWYSERFFPYTQPVSDLYALDAALDIALSQGPRLQERHRALADAVRKSIVSAGLELYPRENFSNTVTSVLVPEGITFSDIFDAMLNEHGIIIAGAFDFLKGKVFRLGHMGENCSEDKLFMTLRALDKTLEALGFQIKARMHEEFSKLI